MDRQLVIQHLDGSRRVHSLVSGRVSLGRSADNDLTYPDDPVLSRRHLVIERDSGRWYAQDLGSKNGSLLNSEPLTSRREISPGDVVSAGQVRLIFDIPSEVQQQTVLFVPEETPTVNRSSMETNLDEVVAEAGGLEAALRGSGLDGSPRIQALFEAGRELAGHRPLSELFDMILDLAVRSVGAQRGMLGTVESDGLRVRSARGEGMVISNSVRDKVLSERRSLLVTDTGLDQELCEANTIVAQRVKSLIAVPLQTDERVIGIIYVDTQEVVRAFTQEDLNLLTVMANVAAVRIEHARLIEIEQVERAMAMDLAKAAEIQQRLLPLADPHVAGLEVSGRSVPCRSVGGDYYDYLSLPGGRIGVIVADVAGKGMSAALLMSSMQARVQVLSEETDKLAVLVTRLNRSINSAVPDNRFITFFMTVIDPATGEFEYVNAGHNAPYVARATGEVETLTAGGPVLGILKSIEYQSATGRLLPGDMLLLYSDGVSEAQNEQEEEFGEPALEAMLPELRVLSAAEALDVLKQRLLAFMGKAAATDDITAVVVKKV
jgi:serine phosphatase RsbU (regulator of sigma subunit)/pSer/pThr/pTyr-binding forkhead associated (FHA) protein